MQDLFGCSAQTTRVRRSCVLFGTMKFSALTIFAVAPCAAFMTPYHHVAIVSRAGRTRPLYMAEEYVEGARAALNSLPLFLAPTAALAAAQQGLAQKKTLELEVDLTEQELESIKKKIKNSDLQINVSSKSALPAFACDEQLDFEMVGVLTLSMVTHLLCRASRRRSVSRLSLQAWWLRRYSEDQLR